MALHPVLDRENLAVVTDTLVKKLLMLSDVGDADHLKEVSVPLVPPPAVGRNVEDHIGFNLQFACQQPVTLYHATKRFLGKVLKIGYERVTSKTGPGASSHCEVGGFIRAWAIFLFITCIQSAREAQFSPSTVNEHYQLREDIGHV
ncbi:hypothetical protein PHYPSEUDO_004697 [Phytophthora pseudosyringae]|uniref:Uncharacterized protein n=1 Tax=Phytophthora pseudosyringae TaxID=221518 RepID=A0A8T1VMV2_9STRA|nr:hypothetical protein PHYPSEUDO_004697 [Phytophthora pseudosyringae]